MKFLQKYVGGGGKFCCMQVSNVRLELHLITYRTRNKTMNAKVDPGSLTLLRHSILWILLICHTSFERTSLMSYLHKSLYMPSFSEVYVKTTKISSWIRLTKIIS